MNTRVPSSERYQGALIAEHRVLFHIESSASQHLLGHM